MSILDVLDAGRREDTARRATAVAELRAWRAQQAALGAWPGDSTSIAGAAGGGSDRGEHAAPTMTTRQRGVQAPARPATAAPKLAAAAVAVPAPAHQESKEAEVNEPLAPAPSAVFTDVGDGVALADGELIALLRQKPKNVPQLHSRDSFRRFLRGIPRSRLAALLRAAYADLPRGEAEDKVAKRCDLLEGLFGPEP
jgi:hypothetical protein